MYRDRPFFTFCHFWIGMLLAGAGIGKDDNSTTLSELDLAKRDAEDFAKLAKLVKPSVVVIESVDRLGREGGRGTGFVVAKNGVIATNFHAIGEHRDFAIRFADGKTFRPQSILAVDRERDLALVKIDAKDLPTLELGDSNKIDPGQAIFSLGNPLGYSHSVSRGVVAAIREWRTGTEGQWCKSPSRSNPEAAGARPSIWTAGSSQSSPSNQAERWASAYPPTP